MASDISPQKNKGILKYVFKYGTGNETPATESIVKIYYRSVLFNDVVVGDNRKFSSKDEPLKFNLGTSKVIRCWNIAIGTMNKGEIAHLVCDPEHAYGKKGVPPNIPPDASLWFEIELVDLEEMGEDLTLKKNSGVIRMQIKKGTKRLMPTFGETVNIYITGKFNEREFDRRHVEFLLGDGKTQNIVEGIEMALEKFESGEMSKLKIKSELAFRATGNKEFGVPPNADVEYTVILKKVKKNPHIKSLDKAKRVEQAKFLKDKGSNCFKNNRFVVAMKLYQKTLEYLIGDFDGTLLQEKNSLLLACYLNIALCFLKTENPKEAEEAANKALELDAKNEKALFRRGQALLDLSLPELAISDFLEIMKINPRNGEATKKIVECNGKLRKDFDGK